MFTSDIDPKTKFPNPKDMKRYDQRCKNFEEWMDSYETALIELREVLENLPRIPQNLRAFKMLYYLAYGELPEDVL